MTEKIAHSWEGFYAHITRPNKKIKRCVIGKLDLSRDSVSVLVSFQENGKEKKKLMSPILLASLHFLWWDGSVCSENDEDDEKYEFSIPPPCKKLPIFSIPNINLFVPSSKMDSVNWHMEQVNQLVDLLN